jgi:glyoxylase-like metal-dependent hydrolase (beta-lactamase superfamily II)
LTKIHSVQVPIPFPVKWVNAYYVEDSVPTLIDTGIDTEEALQAIRAVVEATGGTLDALARVIVTHGHIDHMGLAGRIAEISGAEVFIHSWDQSKTTVVDDARVVDTKRKYAHFFAEAGVPHDVAAELIDLVIKRLGSMCSPLARVTEMHGGEIFRFDEIDLQVVHSPGHTPGSTCLYDAVHGHLYCGDSLIEEIGFNPATDAFERPDGRLFRSLESYTETMDTLYGLEVRRVFPGHGPPYEKPRDKIRKLRTFHERRRSEILRILTEYGTDHKADPGMSQFSLALQLFPSMQGIERYHRVAAIRAHLEILESEAVVSSAMKEQCRLYRVQE